MQYEFDVPDGQQVEVRLYFYDGYDGTSSVGDRVFDVTIEGQTFLDNFDIIEKYGDDTGAMESFTVTSDGTIDIDFGHVTENPQINAIEILAVEPAPGELGASPSSVDFGDVVEGDTETQTVTVTNLGETGDQTIEVDGASITGANASEFSQDFSGSVTLAPGESTTVDVTFSPTSTGSKSAALELSHNATNTSSPLTVDLAGNGQSTATVGFGAKDTVTSQVSNPTSVEFGPDGRLYVSQRYGAVKVFDVTRTGEDSYDATLDETISTVKNLPNHDDDGSYNSNVNQREVTGLTVVGTASQPVIYVTSSDPRVGGGGSGDETGLDTNSGVVSRLTLQSDGSWEHDMLVRGLPRSEENHATNGVQYYTQNGNEYLLLAQGGHTNQGAPSNNFAYTPEYALSAAILKVNLTQINNQYTEKAAANTNAEYLYDLPTLNGTSTPFGGQDGENMAKLVQGDPVSIFSPGYRNPYDVERTEDGQVYTVDNGPNGGWGGQPVGEGTDPVCTNEPNENPSESNGDNLHYVTEGFYGGHPNPTRANPDGAGLWEETSSDPQKIGSTAGAVYSGYDGSAECDYKPSAEGDGALWENGASTNGMDEYTATNFDGKMQGDLLTASFDGNVYRIQLTSDGTDISTEPTALLTPGNTPLDVDAVGDDGPFPGTIFVAEFGGAISAYEPNDYDTGSDGTTCTGDDDPTLDEDGDGYDNADEIDAGSDPCSASSTPPDYDDDGTSNVNDPDDDNDGIDDVNDEFAVDPDNGLTTTLPVERSFVKASVPDSLEGVGFTGLMIPEDGSTDYQDLYIPGDTVFGGANPALTVEAVKPGDATNNDQQHAYQFGINPPSEEFVVDTTVTGFTDDPDQYESAGIFVGTGDQDNYRKLTVNGFGGGTSGEYGVQLFGETGGSNLNDDAANANVSDQFSGPGTTTRLELVVDPTTDPAPGNGADEVNVTGYYTIDDGPRTMVGSTAMPAAWLNTSDGNGLAVGVISTSYQGDEQFSVTWNDLNVTTTAAADNSPPTASFTASPSSPTVGEEVTFDGSASSDDDGSIASYSWDFDGDGAEDATGQTATTTYDSAGDYDVTLTVTDDDGATDATTQTVTVSEPSDVVLAVNTGGNNYTASDGTEYIASSETDVFTGGTDYSVGDGIANTTDDPLYQTELYGNSSDSSSPPAPNVTASVQDGTYEVTLKFAELFQGSSDARVFDVYIEGDQKLDNYDIFAEVGNFTATDKTYTVEVTDGELNINFTAEEDNAKIGAVKVVRVGDVTPETTSADVAITPNSDVEASTYTGGSYQVTNTGETNITTLRMDLNETLLPDMVFDPFNTAGDDVGKEFSLDGGDVTVENVEYTNFHNGVNNSAGYDSLVVTLSGFEPSETMSFSIDNDPTSISSTNLDSQAAGPVSGLEITGGTISVGSGSGPIEATIVGDGSAGGAQATVAADTDESKPSIGVQGVSPTDIGLSDRHSATTVGSASQTVTISDAPANADVTLLRVEGELNLSNVPDPYEIEDYEANKAVTVEYYSATADSNGDATVDVTLTDSGTAPESGLNYFTAWVEEPDGDTGPISDYVVLELEANTAPSIGSITDKGVSEGESLVVDVPASDADGDALDLSVDGPAFVTADDANGTVSIAPGDGTVGTYPVTVTASDGQATASEEFAVYVDEPDQDGQVVYAANAGDGSYTATDGTEYADDANFTGGTAFSTGQAGTPSDPDIGNTDDDTLYQTELYGPSIGYDVPIENGTYEVTLQFAEIYQGVSSNDSPDSSGPTDGTNENDRLFNVSTEGQQVLWNYDIYSEVGPLNATDKSYTVEVTDGSLNVSLSVVNDNAKISAITIEQLDAGLDPIDGFENPPADPDGDGLYEDVNGDGSVNVGDAQALFVNTDGSVVENNVDAFDYNDDGSVNVGDAQALFANGVEV